MAIRYKDLIQELKLLIDDYINQGINKMPSEPELCDQYQLSRQTVRMALKALKEEGLIESKRGSGSYITGRRSYSGGNKIALLLTNRYEYIYPELIDDIHSTLIEAGFIEEIYTTNNRILEERAILSELIQNPPLGIIVEGCKSALPNPNLDLYKVLEKKGVFFVFLFNYYKGFEKHPCIKGDNEGGAALLTNHLIAQGHKEIGGIFKQDDLQGLERYYGFAKTMAFEKLTLPDENICWINTEELERIRLGEKTNALKTFLSKRCDQLSSLVCYNDEIAYYAMRELSLLKKEVPNDVAIGAFDNTYLSNYGIITVTTLSHQRHEMGRLAANAAIAQAKGLPVFSQEVPWLLSVRESTTRHND